MKPRADLRDPRGVLGAVPYDREQMAWAPELQCRGHQRVPPLLNVRTIGRSKCGWRMHGAVGAVHDENCPAARVMPD